MMNGRFLSLTALVAVLGLAGCGLRSPSTSVAPASETPPEVAGSIAAEPQHQDQEANRPGSTSTTAPETAASPSSKGTPQRPLPPSTVTPLPPSASGSSSEGRSLDAALTAFAAEQGATLTADDYDVAYADLNGDRQNEALVLMTDTYWCGTGGCNLVVFEHTGGGYRPRSNISLVRAPVWVAAHQTHGWHDLVLEVSGGGLPAKTVALQFDGSAYPSNPSVEAAIAFSPSPQDQPLFASTP